MDYSFSTTSSGSVRQNLVNRANRIIEQHSLRVPRSWSLAAINYHFWAAVFNHIFGIKCDASIRLHAERIDMIKSCLNMLEIMIGQPLEHIKAGSLLSLDTTSIQNFIEVIELWDHSSALIMRGAENTRQHLGEVSANVINGEEVMSRSSSSSSLDGTMTADQQQQYSSAKSIELANKLDKSLRNQILAMEIEKKVKLYLGDVSVQSARNAENMRASRQSIIRTRDIQPLATFDFSLNRTFKRNTILSSDLQRLFPEIPETTIRAIQEQEKRLLMSQRNIRIWKEHLANKQVNGILDEAISHQRKRLELLEKEVNEEDSVARAKRLRAQHFTALAQKRQERAQKAALQVEIEQMYKNATAAYLNARSHLEQILVKEFKKVDAKQRQQINEIRKYLDNHYEVETDKLRTLLDSFDSMLN